MSECGKTPSHQMSDPSECLFGALTLTAIKRLGDDTLVVDVHGQLQRCRVVRVGDVALVDMAADDSGPRCINCYSVEVERLDGIDGCKFKLDPAGLIYSLQWLHNGTPPDLHLALVQDVPEQWVNAASLTLLSALRRLAPHAIDWSGMQDIVPVLDAFEAARENGIARRH